MIKRFLDKVELNTSDKCWNWKASLRNGYGAFKLNGKVIDAHRVSYIIHIGNIPNGMYVCHTCDNKRCVNPKHLFLGTHADNMKDAYDKGRLIIPEGNSFKNGHHPVNARFTKERANELKKLIKIRKGTLEQLAEQENVSFHLIKDISAGRTY